MLAFPMVLVTGKLKSNLCPSYMKGIANTQCSKSNATTKATKPRVAVCLVGQVRSFDKRTTRAAFRSFVVEALKDGDNAAVDIFAFLKPGTSSAHNSTVEIRQALLHAITHQVGADRAYVEFTPDECSDPLFMPEPQCNNRVAAPSGCHLPDAEFVNSSTVLDSSTWEFKKNGRRKECHVIRDGSYPFYSCDPTASAQRALANQAKQPCKGDNCTRRLTGKSKHALSCFVQSFVNARCLKAVLAREDHDRKHSPDTFSPYSLLIKQRPDMIHLTPLKPICFWPRDKVVVKSDIMQVFPREQMHALGSLWNSACVGPRSSSVCSYTRPEDAFWSTLGGDGTKIATQCWPSSLLQFRGPNILRSLPGQDGTFGRDWRAAVDCDLGAGTAEGLPKSVQKAFQLDAMNFPLTQKRTKRPPRDPSDCKTFIPIKEQRTRN